MREQLYTVTAKQKTGESFARQHLTFKQSSGLVMDLHSWGCPEVNVIPEREPDSLMIDEDCRTAHRHAFQIAVLFVLTAAVLTLLVWAAISWFNIKATPSAPRSHYRSLLTQ